MLAADGNYLPAGYSSDPFPSANMKRLLDKPLLNIMLELLGPQFAQHINHSPMNAIGMQLTLRCLAMVCASKDDLTWPRILHDLLQVVRGSPTFWRNVFELFSEQSPKTDEFQKDLKTVVATLRSIIQPDLSPDVISKLQLIIPDLQPYCTPRFPSIIPSLVDFDAVKPSSLQPNRLQGKYESIMHYVSLQMALVRQDFMQNLFDGIQAVRTKQSTTALRQHKNILIERTKLKNDYDDDDDDGSDVNVIRVQDVDGQPLMVGALLLFTDSELVADFNVALVVHTDAELARCGYVRDDSYGEFTRGKYWPKIVQHIWLASLPNYFLSKAKT